MRGTSVTPVPGAVAYSLGGGVPGSRIRAFKLGATVAWNVTSPNDRRVDDSPIWSPNGKKLAFVRITYSKGLGAKESETVDVVAVSGAHLRRLVNIPLNQPNHEAIIGPSWSP